MQLVNGWYEIDDKQCDYRKGLKHCTLRLARVSKDSTEWVIEITVGLLMVGAMRQIIEADTAEKAMEVSEDIARERFEALEKFYGNLVKEVVEKTEKKKSNEDHIRSMSNKELAEFLEKIVSGDRDKIGINCGNSKCEKRKCTECIGVWLQSESKG